jgi:hypothetical protein
MPTRNREALTYLFTIVGLSLNSPDCSVFLSFRLDIRAVNNTPNRLFDLTFGFARDALNCVLCAYHFNVLPCGHLRCNLPTNRRLYLPISMFPRPAPPILHNHGGKERLFAMPDCPGGEQRSTADYFIDRQALDVP